MRGVKFSQHYDFSCDYDNVVDFHKTKSLNFVFQRVTHEGEATRKTSVEKSEANPGENLQFFF